MLALALKLHLPIRHFGKRVALTSAVPHPKSCKPLISGRSVKATAELTSNFCPAPDAARCYSVFIERQGLSIFLVDDEELITKSLAQILRNEGFEVSEFTNPLKALSRLKVDCPNLLISDVMMPELNGIELARHTRKLLPDCSVLLFSAAAEDLLRDAGPAGIGFRLVSKPVHPDQLFQEIESATAACRAGIKAQPLPA